MTKLHPPAGPEELHIWWLAVPPPGAATRAVARLLDAGQRHRVARLRRPLHRHRKVMAHAGLRTLLAEYTGREPEKLTLRRAACPACGGPHGRPFQQDTPDLEYSMAHSGDRVVYAFADRPVGVDLEGSAVPARTVRTVSRWLAADERRLLEELPEERRPAAFGRCWVRREAYLKGVGTGLAHGVGAAPADGTWRLVDLDPPQGYVAAAALPAAPQAVVRVRGATLPVARILDLAARTETAGGGDVGDRVRAVRAE
ncbi:4'-phosphopantetheinyl transferase superfamily protein [Streptomyces sp. RY43-2]|uniref:4'-phosphopantetheinyl transferase superfamily protein n=1 Tax=Streptomyces macrolidinus TaxID=2952607 RepID=A0ABT0ZMN9_9ACTN|nr:4'-phosphopantetheinyl transferase superfamily protein [Streptomyces macrolidinus]MCN9244846.1 4'-phosphopantetheinyl transferase superfamily protein [Streptomyces macrolidinus]